MELSANQESILLKGLSSNVLQMSKPTIKVVNNMLREWGLQIIETKEEYSWRGLPCTTLSGTDLTWYVGGSFSNDYTSESGILEWCTSLEDAEERLKLMRKDINFSNLSVGNTETEIFTERPNMNEFFSKHEFNTTKFPQYGEFTLSFDEAMDYLKKSDFKAKVTYESAINGTYVKRSSNEDFTMWADYDGIGNSKWYKFGQRINGDVCHSNEKWAIVS